jgi:alkanesulfonate monooxygenase SsuD/methylene tetrahydromethanopterin reductase-like flavin-dependent oxidoreductase (luciferase family)
MVMKVGVMLPLGRPFTENETERIELALSLGYTSLWLQEWPVGSGPPGQRDHGSGHDPLLFALHLASRYGSRGTQIGTAVVRLDYRYPPVTARAVVSTQALAGHPLLLGLGMETGTEAQIDLAAQAWLTIHMLLHAGQEDVFLLPPGFVPPLMYLASGKPELWSAIGYQADGWITTRFDPRQLEGIAQGIRPHVPDLDIIVQVFWRLDTVDASALRQVSRGAMQIGEHHLRALVRHWKSVGVNQVIYFAPETPSADQLRMFADAILEDA